MSRHVQPTVGMRDGGVQRDRVISAVLCGQSVPADIFDRPAAEDRDAELDVILVRRLGWIGGWRQ